MGLEIEGLVSMYKVHQKCVGYYGELQCPQCESSLEHT